MRLYNGLASLHKLMSFQPFTRLKWHSTPLIAVENVSATIALSPILFIDRHDTRSASLAWDPRAVARQVLDVQ